MAMKTSSAITLDDLRGQPGLSRVACDARGTAAYDRTSGASHPRRGTKDH